MDAVKIQALVDAEKIPEKILVKWFSTVRQQWPSGEDKQIPVLQAYCECGLRLPAHPFLTLVLEHFGVELVNLGPNSITMLSVFVYLCEERMSRQSKATLTVRLEDRDLVILPRRPMMPSSRKPLHQNLL